MRICVFGAGAIGGNFAARLAAAGNDVSIVARGAHLEAIRARQIPLQGVAFIGEANPESEQIITEIGKVKRLGRLPVIEPLTCGRLAGVFSKTFDKADFA